ncbi:MAG: glycoside hydrolase family 3 C-terminal domain-containing protein [Tessaracoccus sp.]
MSQNLLSQESTTALDDDRYVDPAFAHLAYQAACEGTVLLRNDDALPFAAGRKVAVFGRCQVDWFAVGYGSGGDVNAPYVTRLLDSLETGDHVAVHQATAARYRSWCEENPVDHGEWGSWPTSYPEMPVEDSWVGAAAGEADAAIVVIGRAAGEDRDNSLTPGSYYLTDDEQAMLEAVTGAFRETIVVVNTGNLMDLSWIEKYRPSAVLLAWLGGMEGGRAVADILTGTACPGGRLTATIARDYQDYPSSSHFGGEEFTTYAEDIFVGYRYFETFAPQQVLFPFGFGLGYTHCDITTDEIVVTDQTIGIDVTVTNTGERAGREVVQVYAGAPDGALSQPARTLVAFAKSNTLEPGESQRIRLEVPVEELASYDDAGATGHRSAYVMEAGDYPIFVGANAQDVLPAGTFHQPELHVVQQREEVAAPEHAFDRMTRERDEHGDSRPGWEPVPTRQSSLRDRILARLPQELPASDGEITFDAVIDGTATLDAFVAQLPPEELARLCHGDVTMNSPLGAHGNAGALGGVSEELRRRSVPPVITTDGPSGLRLSTHAALLPCGTTLASTWDTALVERLAAEHGKEMRAKGSDVLLSPGMNIHRDPLCGRNFEYFSEDPLLTGRFGAAVVRGVQSNGVSACPKHFAANNQEFRRTTNDSRVSERALREIYLRGFEICVKEAAPLNIMTSYNKINGVWGHYHYDLVTTILRGEWGYDGTVITDWWMRPSPDPDFPGLRDSAYRVRAQVDVLMPGEGDWQTGTIGDSILEGYRHPDGLTLGELQRSARTVLNQVRANEAAVERWRGGE